MKKYFDNTTRKEWTTISTPVSRRLSKVKVFIKNLLSKKDIWSF